MQRFNWSIKKPMDISVYLSIYLSIYLSTYLSIDNQLKHVKNVNREELLRPKERGNKNIGIPFIVTYHPHLKHLGKLIQNNIKHLYADFKVRTAFCFYQGFLSLTLTTHRTAGKGRGPSFILLYHFHPLTNIQTFICNFAYEMTITYF